MPQNHEQPNLFEIDPIQGQQEVDVAKIAEHIAANARFEGAEDRTSEAARDQGWGPVDIDSRPEQHSSTSTGGRKAPSRSGLSSYGKMMADREPDREHDPAYQDTITLTPEEIESGRRGIEATKTILAQQKANRDIRPLGRGRGPGR